VHALPPRIDIAFVRGIEGEPDWVPEVLDAGELARWHALHAIGRPLFLAAHVGVRMLATQRIIPATDTPTPGSEPSEFAWVTLPSGKPALTYRDGRPQPLHMSVAHGGGLAAVAVCDAGPIGIDVERVDARRNLLAIAKRFYAPEEYEALARCGADERMSLFHQWWTRKEAVLKATGTGLRGGLDVRVDAPPDSDCWRAVTLNGHPEALFVRDIRPPEHPRVFGAIAIEGQPASITHVSVRLDQSSRVAT